MIYVFETVKKDEVEASSYTEAKSKSEGELKTIDGVGVVGFCAKCGEPIKATDDYLISKDSKMYLSNMVL